MIHEAEIREFFFNTHLLKIKRLYGDKGDRLLKQAWAG